MFLWVGSPIPFMQQQPKNYSCNNNQLPWLPSKTSLLYYVVSRSTTFCTTQTVSIATELTPWVLYFIMFLKMDALHGGPRLGNLSGNSFWTKAMLLLTICAPTIKTLCTYVIAPCYDEANSFIKHLNSCKLFLMNNWFIHTYVADCLHSSSLTTTY